MPGTGGAALRVILRLAGHAERDLGERVAPGVGAAGRIAVILFQRPAGNAALIEVDSVQMVDPGVEADAALRYRSQAHGGIGPVAGDPCKELRYQQGMVEGLLLLDAQVG